MSRKSSTNRSGTSNPSANADSSPSRIIASGTTRSIAWPSTGTKPSRAVNGSSASPLFEGESRITIDSTSAGRCSASAVGDAAAHRVADDVGAPHAEAVERRRHEPRLALHPVALLRLLRAAVPEQVEADHAVVARKRGRHLVPPVERAGEPVQQHHGRRVPRAVLAHLEVAARQVDDAPGVGVRRLGLAGPSRPC